MKSLLEPRFCCCAQCLLLTLVISTGILLEIPWFCSSLSEAFNVQKEYP